MDADRVLGTACSASFAYGPLNRGLSAGSFVHRKMGARAARRSSRSRARGSGRFEVVLADRIRLQKSEEGSLEASLEQVSRKQAS
jgi:hypothetical protein